MKSALIFFLHFSSEKNGWPGSRAVERKIGEELNSIQILCSELSDPEKGNGVRASRGGRSLRRKAPAKLSLLTCESPSGRVVKASERKSV